MQRSFRITKLQKLSILLKGTLHSKLAIDFFSWLESIFFTMKTISIDAVVT